MAKPDETNMQTAAGQYRSNFEMKYQGPFRLNLWNLSQYDEIILKTIFWNQMIIYFISGPLSGNTVLEQNIFH